MALKRTPLARGISQLKRTALKRSSLPRGSSSLRRTATTRTRERSDPVTAETRATVRRRSHGRCEARAFPGCTGIAEHMHHRKLRRFGDHRDVNLLDLCHGCHAWVHGHPTAAYDNGMLLRQHEDPAEIVVVPGW